MHSVRPFARKRLRGDDVPKQEPEAEAALAAKLYDDVWHELLAADDVQLRWLRILTNLIYNRNTVSDPSDRVQLAFDFVYIAACERMRRILNSDLPGVDDEK